MMRVPVAAGVPLRAADRLHQHEEPDHGDEPVADHAHSGQLGRCAAEELPQGEVDGEDRDDGGDHMGHRDLDAHPKALGDLCVASQEIGDDDELAVSRTQRVDRAV